MGAAELNGLIEGGVPEEALRFFARWWQFETYLRELVYLELRARDGQSYEGAIGKGAINRARGDARNAYMASADLEPLDYLDAGELLKVIEANWSLFEGTLLPQARWVADATLIKTLRNRVSHCRRPHSDDLGRLRQLLRDLEHGARIFYSSATSAEIDIPRSDPMAKLWIKGRHQVAARLLDHAENQYDTRFYLHASRRPWAAPPNGGLISGSPGYFWHANWLFGGREIDPGRLWHSICRRSDTAARIVHLLLPNQFHATATFAAVEETEAVADAIGAVFDSLLEESQEMKLGDLTVDHDWREAARDLPAKVQTYTSLALFDAYNPVAIFDA